MRLLLLIAFCVLPSLGIAAQWRLDPATRVAVDVGWQGRSVEVRFTRLAGTIEFDEVRPAAARARVVVSARDVDTGLGLVDALVRSRDYLGAERWPEIVFELDRLERTSSETADVFGQMTLRGVTRPVAFAARVIRYGPDAADPERFVAGFDIAGAVDRTAFGSTGGLPDVAAEIGVRIRLVMTSR